MSRKGNKPQLEITALGKIVIGLVIVLFFIMLFSGYSFDALESLLTIGLLVFLFLNWISK